MNNVTYKPLESVPLGPRARVLPPDLSSPRPVRIDSPAVEVMTDLRMVSAATVGEDTQIDQASQLMIARGVRSLLVIDASSFVVGLITARDIHGERPMQVVKEQALHHDELRVRHVMTAADRLEAIDMSVVLRSQVGHVMATLRATGRQHALVLEGDSGRGVSTVRGIFSISQLARQLGVPVHQTEVARTFADIEAAIGA
jgi:CBS-domain-containing membrane protein